MESTELPGQLSLFDEGNRITEKQINGCLGIGSGFQNGRTRILEQFRKELPAEQNIAFLRHEYGTGGMWPALVDGSIELRMDYDGKGIRIGIIGEKTEVRLSWAEVERRIRSMISAAN